MPDRDVVLAKVAAVQRCLRRIKDVTGLDAARLDDLDVQDIFVLNLQRAIQSSIDLATHLIACEGLGIADSVGGNFVLLANAKIITKTLSKKMRSMVGFRNIAIHEYQALDADILKAILIKNLQDIEQFYTTILHHCGFSQKERGRRN